MISSTPMMRARAPPAEPGDAVEDGEGGDDDDEDQQK